MGRGWKKMGREGGSEPVWEQMWVGAAGAAASYMQQQEDRTRGEEECVRGKGSNGQ